MDLNPYFKSVLEQDTAAIVLCDLNHTIVYMVALRDEDGTLIGYYEKHDSRKAETMKQYDLF